MLDGTIRVDALRRLARIRGQVEGLTRMVEQSRYCVDVITQVAAVEAALHALAGLVLKNHLATCVAESFQSGDARDRREKTEELMRVFTGMRPK